MSDYLDNWATQTYLELNEPSGISATYIKNWFLSNVGNLNIVLNATYSGVTGSISPQISGDAQYIFKELFNIAYYSRLITQNLGANAYSTDFTEVKEGDSSIRRVSKNEIAKTYMTLKRQSQETLTDLIKMWRMNQCNPQSIDYNNSILYPRGASDPLCYVRIIG